MKKLLLVAGGVFIGMTVFAGVAVLLVVILNHAAPSAVPSQIGNDVVGQIHAEANVKHHVVAVVTVDPAGSASLTAPGEDVLHEQVQGGRWTRALDVGRFDYVDVTGQADRAGATVTCALYENGQLLTQQHASGPYATVSCSPEFK